MKIKELRAVFMACWRSGQWNKTSRIGMGFRETMGGKKLKTMDRQLSSFIAKRSRKLRW